jgi:hypothetical protein
MTKERHCSTKHFTHEPHEWVDKKGLFLCPGTDDSASRIQHDIAFALVIVAIIAGFVILWRMQ